MKVKDRNGNYFELTLENAKEYYKSEYCNTFSMFDDRKFYFDNFTKSDFLVWNNEKVNELLDDAYRLFECEDNIDTVRDHCQLFIHISGIYIENHETYKRMINYLKKLYSTYGYFMNYFLFDVDREDRTFNSFCLYYIGIFHTPKQLILNAKSPYFYEPSRKYDGLIANLYYLGFNDLLEEYLIDCLIPICLNYHEKSKYMKDNNMMYFRDDNELKNYTPIVLFKKFIFTEGVSIPKELEDILKEV